jgi:hypothetical protein
MLNSLKAAELKIPLPMQVQDSLERCDHPRSAACDQEDEGKLGEEGPMRECLHA